MNDDHITFDGKISNDEKSSGSGKLESMSKEELIKIIKNQILLKKKLDVKITELTDSNKNLQEIEKDLRIEIDQDKTELEKLKEELNNLRQSSTELSIFRTTLLNENQNSSFHSELLLNSLVFTIDLFQLPLSLPDSINKEFFEIYKNELEQKHENYKQIFDHFNQEKNDLKQRIEDLEFFNEEIKFENEDLRLKVSQYESQKKSFEIEIDNYRRQIEDFEEQFLELQRESHSNQLDDQIKSSSTSSLLLSTDIPTLLHSIGITNASDDDFSIPLNFESILRLCTLVIERCQVLQYMLLKTNDTNTNEFDRKSISIFQNNLLEQCQICIHKHEHFVLDTIFEQIYQGMNEELTTDNWQIIIEKSLHQKTSPPIIRLEFDKFKFISKQIEDNLRLEYQQLSQENIRLNNEISQLKFCSINSTYEQLKNHQTDLEQQLNKQCEKTIQLENILQQVNLDKIRLDQLQQIENSYKELQEKYQLAEQLEKQYHEQTILFQNQTELFNKLKLDYERQHFERNEQEQLIEKYQKQLKQIEINLEQQKSSILNVTENQDQKYLLLNQRQDQFKDLIDKKLQENEILFEKNFQLENELKVCQLKYDEIQKEKLQLIESNQIETENIQELKDKYQKMKVLLTRLKKEFQEKNHIQKQNLIDLELADYEKTIDNLKKDLVNKDKDLQELRDELLNSTEKYSCLKIELENLEEQKNQIDQRATKFKLLLDNAKKELQNAKDREIQRFQNEEQMNELIQTLQQQSEDNQLIIKDLKNEKQQLIDKYTQQTENQSKTIQLLEQNLRIAKHDIDIAKKDYDTLQDDFNSYKVRAQSVLKQQQINQRERTSSSLADKQNEFDQLIEKFQFSLENANKKIQLLMSENEALQKEQDRLIEIQAKLLNEGKKREQDMKKQHQIEIEKIENNFSQKLIEYQDTNKNLSIQNETITRAFKEQIATIESEHEHANVDFQNQINLSQQEIEQLKNRIYLLQQTNFDQEKFISDLTLSQQENINIQKSNENQDELTRIKTQLINLTEQFNETEMNNQRLTEQIILLKEEIRRLERNMDRAESISNLEYLKNIVIKFLTLKLSIERLQLIPVLVTMLKLSPDEQAQLVRVANMPINIDDNSSTDQTPSQQSTNGADALSWSSYLNIW